MMFLLSLTNMRHRHYQNLVLPYRMHTMAGRDLDMDHKLHREVDDRRSHRHNSQWIKHRHVA